MPVYETEKKIKKPTAIQKAFHDVKEIAVFERVKIAEGKTHVVIWTSAIREYHYIDGRIEETDDLTTSCARIPKELLGKTIKELRRVK